MEAVVGNTFWVFKGGECLFNIWFTLFWSLDLTMFSNEADSSGWKVPCELIGNCCGDEDVDVVDDVWPFSCVSEFNFIENCEEPLLLLFIVLALIIL